jgi:uncharacterized repeat protein (TIGR01451 family)
MKRQLKMQVGIMPWIAVAMALTLPAPSWANISNTANASFLDGANGSHTATSNTVTVTVTSLPIITLTKSASPMTAVAGTTVTFTIAYSNTGGAATNFVITDTVPTGSTLVAGSQGTGTVSGGVITWTIGSVAANGSGSVSFQVTVN